MPSSNDLAERLNIASFKDTSYEKFLTYDYTKHLTDSNLLINETDCSFYEINLTNQAGIFSKFNLLLFKICNLINFIFKSITLQAQIEQLFYSL